MIQMSSVLVATDFGETSDAALVYGRNLARAFGARLHVLNIVEKVRPTAGQEFYPEDLESLQADILEAATIRLDALLTTHHLAALQAKPVVRASTAAAAAIIDYAKEAHVDIIVVGTHGRRGVSHLFMGSVAEDVVRRAPCPVLVVRPSEHEFVLPDHPVGVYARI